MTTSQPANRAGEGRICPQLPPQLDAVMGRSLIDHPQGEDCLNLSLATPGCDGAARPVMVFFHGGGFGSGGGVLDWYDGGALAAAADVVVVGVNYRLGAFGYLCLDGVCAGNLGLFDQLEALRWVRAHIAGYGGDPANVTVFGQSAGALSIRLLLEIPGARGLFGRAILQSGPPGFLARPRGAAERIGRVFADRLGEDPRTASVPALLAAHRDTAAALAGSGDNPGPPFYPVVEAEPLAALGTSFSENVAGLDVLCGWNADDASAFVGPAQPRRIESATRDVFARPIGAFADRLTEAGARVHTYRLDWRPLGSPFGATHCVELPLLLGARDAWQAAPMLGETPWEEVELLGGELRRVWGTFARTGAVDTESETILPLTWHPRPA
jgi:para-nitrobenzyl esterase